MAKNLLYKKINFLEYNSLKKKIQLFKKSSKNFQRFVLHNSSKDLIQIMIMMYKKNFDYPFHYTKNSTESFSVIYGKFSIFFKINGKIKRYSLNQKSNFVYKINSNILHKIKPESNIAVALEILNGPYKKGMLISDVKK